MVSKNREDRTKQQIKQTNNNHKLLKTISVKNFTKLLMAVVLLASYSCVQDTTEDLAPVISEPNGGSGEVKTLQVSMPVPSRTSLGEKVGDKYPVSWCEDDVLAVNGKPTTSITISEEAANVAVFDLPLGITIPYHIVYPYQGEDVAVNAQSGAYPVVFASEQMHTAGTFAQNSAPMYAWSNGFDDVHMEHLATALCFNIKAKDGETVDLKYVSVATVGAEPISGTFDVYCGGDEGVEPGTLQAREDAFSTVFYNFEGGSYTLTGDKAEQFFIAVPKGEYSRFEVNFVSQSGAVYTETFDASGDKKLRGGVVREFPLVEFEANSKMFLIGNDVDMANFAAMVKNGTFNNDYDGALLVSDVTIPEVAEGKNWTPIEGYTSVFEGRNFTISGLDAPLFGENVVATISNVRVVGDLVEESNGKVGMIARSLAVDGDKIGTIFNCSAAGSIEYKNKSLTINENFDLINVGGIVGGVYGGSVSLSESDVNITISTVAGADASDKTFTPCIGGVVGYACAVGENLPVVVENTSSGIVTWDDQSKSAKVTPYIGGVAGYVTAGTFTDNVNSGELYISEPMYDLDWGGVIGASSVAIERCENKGSLTINEAVTKANIGGVLGKLEFGSIVDCENSGKLLFDELFFIKETCHIGGVIAYAEKGTKNIQNCTNSGSVTYLGSCNYKDRNNITENANIVLGGVVGICWSEVVSDCRNLASAEMNVAGKISGNGTKNAGELVDLEYMTAVAGVIGVRAGKQSNLGCSSAVLTENCSNQGNVSFTWQYCGKAYLYSSACVGIVDSDRVVACKNEGSVYVQGRVSTDVYDHPDTATVLVYVSGLFGCIKSTCEEIADCENAGLVEVLNTNSRMLYVSGMFGTAMPSVVIKLSNCANTGNIVVGEDVTARTIYIGGILASTNQVTMEYPNCYNSGKVESKATATAETYLGSIFGWSAKSNVGEGVRNSGRVVYSGKSAIAYVGGYCGRYQETSHSVEFTNETTGVVEYNGEASYIAFVGGIAGLGGSVSTTLVDGAVTEIKSINGIGGGDFAKGMSNNGNVTIMGYAPEIHVGGCFGHIAITTNGIGGLSNNGVVEVPENPAAINYPTTICAGGVFGFAKMGVSYPAATGTLDKSGAVRECYNMGDIIYSGIARDGAYVGGIVGLAQKAPIFECANTGKVFSNGHAGEWSPRESEANEKVDKREFAIYFNHDLAVGGVVGETDLDLSGCSNEGEVTHECLLNPLRLDYIGETATSRFDVGGIAGRVASLESNRAYYQLTMNGLINSGEVTIKGVPSATLCSPSADMESNGEYQWTDVDDADRMNKRPYVRVNVAGLVGRVIDLSQKSGAAGEDVENKFFMSGCTNNGAVTVPEAAGAKCLSVAGAVADLLVSHMDFNVVANNGRISVDNAGVGTIIAGKQMMHAFFINLGGIVATYFDHRIFANTAKDWAKGQNDPNHYVSFSQCTNDGDIHYGEVGASVFQCAGGIVGQILHTAADRSVNIGTNGYTAGKWYKSFTHVTFTGCKNGGDIDYKSTIMASLSSHWNYSYGGGILGSGGLGHASLAQWYNAISLKFDHCENSGAVQFDRSNGVASDNSDPFMTCVGGIVGHYTGGIGKTGNGDAQSGTATTRVDACNAEIISCKNSGYIHGFSGILGGIIGNGNWYVKITGTPEDPTINTGDIVVLREGNQVVTKNRYGRKYLYAGGIAGYMREYHDASYAIASASESTNNGHPAYMPEHMYCRIEHAVNEGAVGSTGYAGGIAGYYWSAVEPSNRTGKVIDHRGGLEFCRNSGDIYALEETTVNVGSIVGMPRMFTYSGTDADDVSSYLLSQEWQNGVRNCEVGGTILRGAIDKYTVDATNYMHFIYGETWLPTFVSVLSDSEFDGCVLYVPAVEETPEGGEGGEDGVEPAAKR